jgi:hypothetical protein
MPHLPPPAVWGLRMHIAPRNTPPPNFVPLAHPRVSPSSRVTLRVRVDLRSALLHDVVPPAHPRVSPSSRVTLWVRVDLRNALLHDVVPPAHPRVSPSHLVKSGVHTDRSPGIRDDATRERVIELAAVRVRDIEAVVHGRTARAGQTGTEVLVLAPYEDRVEKEPKEQAYQVRPPHKVILRYSKSCYHFLYSASSTV